MHRLDLARKLGVSWPNAILPFTHRATKRFLISCRCQRNWFILPERGELTNSVLYNLEALLSCECIPPLAECVTPEELKQLLMSLPLDALHELRDAILTPQSKSPRQQPTDEGSVRARNERSDKKNDSSANIASQSRILGNEYQCAVHVDCAGHEPPEGAA